METNKYITPVMERVIKLQSQIKDLEIENLEYRQKIIELQGVIADQAILLKHMQTPIEDYLDD